MRTSLATATLRMFRCNPCTGGTIAQGKSASSLMAAQAPEYTQAFQLPITCMALGLHGLCFSYPSPAWPVLRDRLHGLS